jgi:hypothetical protein
MCYACAIYICVWYMHVWCICIWDRMRSVNKITSMHVWCIYVNCLWWNLCDVIYNLVYHIYTCVMHMYKLILWNIYVCCIYMNINWFKFSNRCENLLPKLLLICFDSCILHIWQQFSILFLTLPFTNGLIIVVKYSQQPLSKIFSLVVSNFYH